jgi:hypothetical protein
MTKAMAAIEQRSSGQIGHPAACMIENNAVLSAGERFWDARLWPLGAARQHAAPPCGGDTTVDRPAIHRLCG